jgi:predicted dehydrogenase
VPLDQLPPGLDIASIRSHDTFEQLLADPGVDFVSLCSPRRIDQASDAVRAMRAGKHVLAEKPCAMNEDDLDAIIEVALETGKCFHEMAGTAFSQPYLAMREAVRSGILGGIVQVIAEKSYPYYDGRAQYEDLDGGQIMQNGIHALRFVEHVAGTPIASVQAVETLLGNPVEGGGLRMAASMVLTLKNGGVASIANNYLNPRGTGIWGCESLKILGREGIVESRAGGAWTRLVVGDKNLGPLDITSPGIPWLEAVFGSILGLAKMPLTLEEELSPTRWAIRAKRSAKRSVATHSS